MKNRMKGYRKFRSALALALVGAAAGCAAPEREVMRALIVDGQNNHQVWPKASFMFKRYLEETGFFEVDIERTRFLWKGESYLPQYALSDGVERQSLPEPIADPEFLPDFDEYDLVVSNFGWKAADWPQETRDRLERFVAGGGGFVVVHAADNSFPEWEEYNRMIGLGGWGGRNESDGPYVYFNDTDEKIVDTSPGGGGTHGDRHQFLVRLRDFEHPVTSGLPEAWLHTEDECYGKLRGPAEHMTVLATAYSDPATRGIGRHEPVLMAIEYGSGRVFHSTLGHDVPALEGVGFIETFKRGAEWAATGKVTRAVPEDFPDRSEARSRPFVDAVSQAK